ncbi:MAG: 2-dehydro-3-deoxygluconokinase [Natronomonas sp.]|jgi:2-dehydro-3-deoxygluconokinase|uniref:PfkB family carbohydrate kinase n=1 Tax=Natronomonas sp. TaxID=2184060 RepID=UPI00398A3660
MQLVTLGGAALRLAPSGSERLETADDFDVGVTGPECNAAVAAGRLGADATWLSRLPDGPLGRRVANELRGHEVDIVASFDSGRQGLTFFERGSKPRGDGRVDDLDGAVFEELTMDALPGQPVEAADTAYVTAATPQASTGLAGATAKFLKTAMDADATTALGLLETRGWSDYGSARDTLEGLFPAVDTLIASASAVEEVLDRSGDPGSVMHTLASNHGFETVVLQRRNDAAVWHDSTVHEFETPAVDAVDVTGAADAFAGAFLALIDAGSAQTALRTAIAADTLVKTTPGALPVFTRMEAERVASSVERA